MSGMVFAPIKHGQFFAPWNPKVMVSAEQINRRFAICDALGLPLSATTEEFQAAWVKATPEAKEQAMAEAKARMAYLSAG